MHACHLFSRHHRLLHLRHDLLLDTLVNGRVDLQGWQRLGLLWDRSSAVRLLSAIVLPMLQRARWHKDGAVLGNIFVVVLFWGLRSTRFEALAFAPHVQAIYWRNRICRSLGAARPSAPVCHLGAGRHCQPFWGQIASHFSHSPG